MGDYTHPILPELLETPKDNKTTTYCLEWQKRECGESRKNLLYGARLNPKHYKTMGNQQLRPKGKVQRLFLLREVHCKRLAVEVGSP